MKNLKQFNIPFVGLKEGLHLFKYNIENTFFESFNFDEFQETNIEANVDFIKKTTLMELVFSIKGTVRVPCDTTNELFDLKINGTMPLIVKFGTEFNNENEEILILPQEAYELNVAQFIYELIVLSVPIKRVHPKVLDGSIQNEALTIFQTIELKEEKTVAEETTDPRWDKLKDLLTGKNT